MQAAVRRAFGTSLTLPAKYKGPFGLAEQALAMSQVRHGVCITGVTEPGSLIKAVTSVATKSSPGAEAVVVRVDPNSNDLGRAGGALFTHMKAARGKSSRVLVFIVMPSCKASVPASLMMEPLNTLFDDHKRVTFDNNEVVAMGDNTRFFVLVDDCSSFSPASISRLGIVNAM